MSELEWIRWCKQRGLLPQHWLYPAEQQAEHAAAVRIARRWQSRRHVHAYPALLEWVLIASLVLVALLGIMEAIAN